MLAGQPKLFFIRLLWDKPGSDRNLWYIKSPLSKEVCSLSGQFVISSQEAKKQNNCTARYK